MQIHELNNYSGNIDEAYTVVDNGTDTGKLSTGNLLRDVNEKISDANARIDNLISGITVDSEVIDARVIGNRTYSTLHDALNTEFTDIDLQLANFFEWANFDTGSTAGSGGAQGASFPNPMKVNTRYKIIVETPSALGTDRYIRLTLGGTMTLIGSLKAGETEVTFYYTADIAYTGIRISTTVPSEEYTYTIYEQTPTTASKAAFDTLAANVEEIDEAVEDSIRDVSQLFVLENLSFTDGYYMSAGGSIGENATMQYSEKIPVNEGDVISSELPGTNIFRFLTAYDADDNAVFEKGIATGWGSYTVPAGIVSVIVTRYISYSSYAVTQKKTTKRLVFDKLPEGIYRAESDLSDTEQLTLPMINVSKGIVETFAADITLFSKIQVGRIKSSEYAYLEIDSTNITIKVDGAADTVIPHGLTIANNIQVRIIQNTEASDNPTKYYRGYIELASNGSIFKTSDMNQMPQGFWTRSYCAPFAKSVGSELTNCVFSYIPTDIKKDIYIFGDSYCSFYAERWIYYLVQNGFDKNVLINSYAGENSVNAVIALNHLFNLNVSPTYAIWCLGMNDGADSASDPSAAWVTGRDEFINKCNEYGIVPVFGTIPSVPGKSNEKKNEWIRNSGYQYIDFAKAVGAQADGTWYSGMLSGDNVHPTIAGGISLYGRVLTDFPQIAYSN